ncbi:efflux RND transporter periplasmic adaptor subunit [Novosphingobium sp.]|uniref:efflux RND transporter periplasmic adaptor subunit n=1 Tax=Novosphingobium sp. TaxID=1874826 RepID=UPI003B529FF6
MKSQTEPAVLGSLPYRRIGTALVAILATGAALVVSTARANRPVAMPITTSASHAGNGFNCVIEPYQTIKLATQAVGVVSKLYFDRGDFVAKGQVLGRLADDVEKANLSLAQTRSQDRFSIGALEAKLAFLHARQARAEKLVERHFVTPALRDEVVSDAHVAEQQLEQARLAVQVARLEVVQTQKVLDQKMIRSPFSGYVTEILLHPGEFRDEKSAILKLAQVDPLRVEVYVPTRYFGRIRRNSIAMVSPEAPLKGAYPARVDVVDSVIDAASGTFGIRLIMANPRRVLPAGLQCQVRFAEISGT